MFVFGNDSLFSQTLDMVNKLSNEEYNAFLEQYGVSTFKYEFERVAKAEWAISDHYESLDAQGKDVPSEPVFSQEYTNALNNGIIRIIKDDEGEYFDYNIYEIHMAPLLNVDGLVKVGDKIYQFGLDTKKIIENGDFNKINSLNDVQSTDTTKSISVVNYHFKNSNKNALQFGHHQWLFASNVNNAFIISPNGGRRFRMYLQGSSYIDDTYNNQRLYVTNILRLEGQKKNFWGSWKYSESYSTNGTVNWLGAYRIDDFDIQDVNLPFGGQIPPSSTSPFSWQYPNPGYSYGVNNATFNLAPHISGYYTFPHGGDCGGAEIPGLCGFLTDGLRIIDASGYGYISSIYLTLNYTVINN